MYLGHEMPVDHNGSQSMVEDGLRLGFQDHGEVQVDHLMQENVELYQDLSDTSACFREWAAFGRTRGLKETRVCFSVGPASE